MADDDFYTVTSDWTAVEANGADITGGTFTVFNLGDRRVGVIKSAGVPTVENGVAFMDKAKDSLKYTLGATEELYAKTDTGTAEIGVIPA